MQLIDTTVFLICCCWKWRVKLTTNSVDDDNTQQGILLRVYNEPDATTIQYKAKCRSSSLPWEPKRRRESIFCFPCVWNLYTHRMAPGIAKVVFLVKITSSPISSLSIHPGAKITPFIHLALPARRFHCVCLCVLIHCLIEEEFPCGVFLAASLSAVQQFQLVPAFLLWVFEMAGPISDTGSRYFEQNDHILSQKGE